MPVITLRIDNCVLALNSNKNVLGKLHIVKMKLNSIIYAMFEDNILEMKRHYVYGHFSY